MSRLPLLRHDLHRLAERLIIKVVWAMPRKLAYWAAIRVISNATVGEHSNQVVPELLAVDALKRWENKR